RSVAHELDAASPGDLVVNSFGYCDSTTDQDMQCPLDYYSNRTDLRLYPFIDSYYRVMDANDTAALGRVLDGERHVWGLYADTGESAVYLRQELEGRYGAGVVHEYKGIELVEYGTR
ncbi:MAG: hypothetical protein ABR562_06135, partial [Thermoplasmatota archaeon]